MSIKAFDLPTMIAISDPWVDSNKDKPMLESYALTAGLVPILASAHGDLLRMQVKPSEKDAEMAALSEQASLLDTVHDERYRALYSILTGWAAVSSEDNRRSIEELRDTLLPEGPAGTRRTYLAEAGNVELSASRLTPEMADMLKSIVVEGKSMYQLFDEWTETGRKLGEVERERARHTERQADGGVSAREVQNARYKWIRAVNALTSLLDLDSDLSDDVRVRILQPLRAAEAKLARKGSAGAEEVSDISEEESGVTIPEIKV